MLKISKDRVYLSTTLHTNSSEGLEDKIEGHSRFRHRYTREEWVNLMYLTADRPFVLWTELDPDDKLWINCLFFKMNNNLPPIINMLYNSHQVVHIHNYISSSLIKQLDHASLQAKDQPSKTILRYERGPNEFDRLENLCSVSNLKNITKILDNLVNQIRPISFKDNTCTEIINNNDKWVYLKDKLNFKVSSSFPPHQDASSGWSNLAKHHITVAVSIDKSNLENGSLEFVHGQWKKLLEPPNPLDLRGVHKNIGPWTRVDTRPGDVLIFSSLVPHRSGPNWTDKYRRIWFLTYVREIIDNREVKSFYQKKRKRQPTMDDGISAEHPRDAFGKAIIK